MRQQSRSTRRLASLYSGGETGLKAASGIISPDEIPGGVSAELRMERKETGGRDQRNRQRGGEKKPQNKQTDPVLPVKEGGVSQKHAGQSLETNSFL